jgi:hypothetical protein
MSRGGKPAQAHCHKGAEFFGKTMTVLGTYPLPRTLTESQSLNQLLDLQVRAVTFQYGHGITIATITED